MANEYATLADLKLHIGVANNADDALLSKALEASSRRIDKRTGRRFYLDGAATTRVYKLAGRVAVNHDGEEGLLVDDIGSLTDLAVETGASGSFTAITGYEVEPENALARGTAISMLRLPTGTWGHGAGARVRVTARWGWPAVPAEVVEAALLLAARLFKRKASPDGTAGVGEWGPIRVSKLDPDVESLIADLALPGFG